MTVRVRISPLSKKNAPRGGAFRDRVLDRAAQCFAAASAASVGMPFFFL